jgi:hypothetical protein
LKRALENERGSGGAKRGKAKDPPAARENALPSRGEAKDRGDPVDNKAPQDEPAAPTGAPGLLAPHGAAASRNEEGKQHRLGPESSGTMSSNMYTFKLPQIDPTIYIQFLDQLLFGNNRKAAIM